MYSGYANRAPATTAVTPSPAANLGSAARAADRVTGNDDHAITKIPPASAVKNSPSAAIEKPTASVTPRINPLRSQWAVSRILSSRHSTSGAIQPEVQLRWPLAWATKPG